MDILPFVSRLPRNDVYASCVSTTAGDCLRMWDGMMGTHPSVGRGVFRDKWVPSTNRMHYVWTDVTCGCKDPNTNAQ